MNATDRDADPHEDGKRHHEGDLQAGAGIVRDHASRHHAPDALRRSIVEAVRAQDAARAPLASVPPGPPAPQPRRRLFDLVLGFGAGAMVAACVAMIAVVAIPGMLAHGDPADEIVDAHLRSMQGAHLTDVATSDRHTVKPWLSARLDFSPPVFDLAAQGFPLEGGRLDYVERRPVAALVYRRQQHEINVFARPLAGDAGAATAARSSAAPPAATSNATAAPASMRTYSRRGINVVGWQAAGMAFSAASDLEAPELRGFAERLREATIAATQ